MVDTLNTALMNFGQEIESVTSKIKNKADLIMTRELIEPLDMYIKHYS